MGTAVRQRINVAAALGSTFKSLMIKATFTLTGFERFGKILQLPTTVFMNLEELGKTWNVLEFMGKIPQ